jgi:hypothetical protein
MQVAFVIVSAVLALEMTGSGVPKLLQLRAIRRSAEHLGLSAGPHRMIGAAEVAAAIGFVIGIAFPPLSIVTGVAVCLLMCGALGYHMKARDNVLAMLPAALTAVTAVVVGLLATAVPIAPSLADLY